MQTSYLNCYLRTLRELLDFIEESFGTGRYHEQELIAASFLEISARRAGRSGAGIIGPCVAATARPDCCQWVVLSLEHSGMPELRIGFL